MWIEEGLAISDKAGREDGLNTTYRWAPEQNHDLSLLPRNATRGERLGHWLSYMLLVALFCYMQWALSF